jgi:hypothetical protein
MPAGYRPIIERALRLRPLGPLRRQVPIAETAFSLREHVTVPVGYGPIA